jgi:hypothetical protein
MRPEAWNGISVMLAAFAVAAVTGCTAAETKPAVTATTSTAQTASAPAPIAAKPAPASGIREPNWQYTGSTDNYESYVDANSISDRNGSRFAWGKHSYKQSQRDGEGNLYTSSVALWAYDCPSSMSALVSLALYAENGSVVYSGSYDDGLDWNHVVPDTIGAAKLRLVCNAFAGHAPVVAAPASTTRIVAASKLSPAEVFQRVRNSVWVLISFNVKNGKLDRESAALGSAVAVGPTTLLTNCHTLKGHAYHLITRTNADEPTPVTVVKADVAGDRCVVRSEERLPSYVEIKPYSAVDIGEEAYSVGTPQGLELTLADGIVSAKRSFDGVRYLQTTAPISHGSSGGGLFDGSGRLIGITTMYRKEGQNLNFAIAADTF